LERVKLLEKNINNAYRDLDYYSKHADKVEAAEDVIKSSEQELLQLKTPRDRNKKDISLAAYLLKEFMSVSRFLTMDDLRQFIHVIKQYFDQAKPTSKGDELELESESSRTPLHELYLSTGAVRGFLIELDIVPGHQEGESETEGEAEAEGDSSTGGWAIFSGFFLVGIKNRRKSKREPLHLFYNCNAQQL